MTQQTVRAAGGILYRLAGSATPHTPLAPDAGKTTPQNASSFTTAAKIPQIASHITPENIEICVVHRTKYGDISFPKGKLEQGESPQHAAVREIGEETGLSAILESPLPSTSYDLIYEGKPQSKGLRERGILKTVDYWVARQIDAGVAQARANPFGPVFRADRGEIEAVRWMPVNAAREALTRPNDREILAEFTARLTRGTALTTPFLIVRHGKAESRKTWHAPDGFRPLTPMGAAAAYALSREIACFAPLDLYSSPWKRCADTIAMYSMQSGQIVSPVSALTEDAFAENPETAWNALAALMAQCAASRRPAAVCMHRPVIGGMLAHLRALCDSPQTATLLPTENPYMPTGTALILGLVWANGTPRIVSVQKVSPLVY